MLLKVLDHIFVISLTNYKELRMKNLFSLLFLFIAAPLIAAPKNEEIEKLLLKLDSLIGKKEIIEKETLLSRKSG